MSYVPHVSTTTNSIYVGGGGSGTGVGHGIGGGSLTNATVATNTTWNNITTVLQPSGQMELKGDQADLIINGVSLRDTLKGIQDRLCMLQPNTALEAEWDQLQELGEQYRKLEADLLAKQKMWATLQK
jgi:hypothetical protein